MMIRWTITALALAVLAPVAAPACSGTDLAVTSLKVQAVNKTQYLNLYRVVGTITNVGDVPQGGNALQFVERQPIRPPARRPGCPAPESR